ncbi:MAG: type II toxin-antitoxin system VapC family toxin [Candidatus Marinimicrobia bacterium]|nr:type II toxin-antitoxin system VapC family toxin [Candidatus Neomarinimicrobiota bacterium]MCK9560405.1 type II toxin-antitoxin system VapC family toxin [Candidatus Neomarinimicrobiota bacterium]MDD5540810.1 type II toxin-antitoxin system VapC family toxin [Candidatus Neomarinimicrobiota bacterium]
MNIVDSCGWLEYLKNGKYATRYAEALEDTRNLLVPVICLYEVFKVILRENGEQQALTVAASMKQSKVIPVDQTVVLLAAKLSLEHQLPMADSIILATSRLNNANILTQDEHFRNLDGVTFVE